MPRASCCTKSHVVVVPGEAFGTQEHVRMSYQSPEINWIADLERMRDFFARL